MDPGRVARGVEFLCARGHPVVLGSGVAGGRGYLAGTDEERAADLHSMFADDSVRAIFCLRGGYGCPRLLPLLDYGLVARHPKIVVGYSDVTALLLALHARCGLTTFHGPMVAVEMAAGIDPFAAGRLFELLEGRFPSGPLPLPPGAAPRARRGGRAEGPLLGGNLTLLASLLGTPYAPDFAGAVLCVEDVGEEPYRVDRLLAHLRNAGVLGGAAAVLAGAFADCVPADPTRPSLSLDEVLDDAAGWSGRPFLSGLPFGHTNPAWTLPIGIRAAVDADAGTLEFLEAAVA